MHAESAVNSVEFTPTLAPETDAERTTLYTRSSAIVTYSDGSTKSFPLTYHTLYHSADKIGHWQAGAIVDKDGKLIPRARPMPKAKLHKARSSRLRRMPTLCLERRRASTPPI